MWSSTWHEAHWQYTHRLSCWPAPPKLSLCSGFQAERRCSCPETIIIIFNNWHIYSLNKRLLTCMCVTRPVCHPAACSCTRSCQLRCSSGCPEAVLPLQSFPHPPLEQVTLNETQSAWLIQMSLIQTLRFMKTALCWFRLTEEILVTLDVATTRAAPYKVILWVNTLEVPQVYLHTGSQMTALF